MAIEHIQSLSAIMSYQWGSSNHFSIDHSSVPS
jgi:hypothetical protein